MLRTIYIIIWKLCNFVLAYIIIVIYGSQEALYRVDMVSYNGYVVIFLALAWLTMHVYTGPYVGSIFKPVRPRDMVSGCSCS